MHADFFRVEANKPIKVSVPLHFINEDTCVGVKLGGGRIQHTLTEVEVLALPADLPEFIEVDMGELQVGEIVHLSDLKLPEGVTSTALALGDDRDIGVPVYWRHEAAKVLTMQRTRWMTLSQLMMHQAKTPATRANCHAQHSTDCRSG